MRRAVADRNLNHLSEQQLNGYRTRSLPAEELLAADDHLFSCRSCRSRLDAGIRARPDGYALIDLAGDGGQHQLPYEKIEDYVDGGLNAAERAEVESHVETCIECRDRVADLLLVRASLSLTLGKDRDEGSLQPSAGKVTTIGPAHWRRITVALAAAILIALSVFAMLSVHLSDQLRSEREKIRSLVAEKYDLQRRSDQEISDLNARLRNVRPEDHGEPPGQGLPPPAVYLVDGGRTIGLRGASVVGLGEVSRYLSESVKEALQSASIFTPSLEGLKYNEEVLMGEHKAQDPLSLSNPVGIVIEDTRPTFSWTPLDPGTIYVVNLLEAMSQDITDSPPVRGNRWRCTARLKRGATYSWDVRATLRDGREILAPTPPAPEAKFRVLDSIQAREIEKAREISPKSHLVLAVLYGRAGLINQARVEMKFVVRENPGSALAKHLLDSLTRSHN